MGRVFPSLGIDDDILRIRRYLPDGLAYQGGDCHPTHSDWYARARGMNVLSAQLYLTSPEEGGRTLFQAGRNFTGFEFQPIRGDLAIWWNCNPEGTEDKLSYHSSTPLKRGIKWNAVRFVMDKAVKCGTQLVDAIEVPDEVESNREQLSDDAPFGTELPPGIEVSELGTSEFDDVDGQDDMSIQWGHKFDLDLHKHNPRLKTEL